jgi:hypothetical protein
VFLCAAVLQTRLGWWGGVRCIMYRVILCVCVGLLPAPPPHLIGQFTGFAPSTLTPISFAEVEVWLLVRLLKDALSCPKTVVSWGVSRGSVPWRWEWRWLSSGMFCSLVEVDRRFRGAYCFHHQGDCRHIQNGCRAYPASYSVGSAVSFLQGSVKVTIILPPKMLSVKKCVRIGYIVCLICSRCPAHVNPSWFTRPNSIKGQYWPWNSLFLYFLMSLFIIIRNQE